MELASTVAGTRITKQLVDSTHSGPKDKLVWDAKLPGFGLKVTPAGSKIFIFQYRLGGRGAKARRYTIGKYGPLTPDQARAEAQRLAMLVAQGADPQRGKVERRRQAVELAFDRYLDRFERDCLKLKWKASHTDAKATLDRFALPVLRDKPLPDIGRSDIRAGHRSQALRDPPPAVQLGRQRRRFAIVTTRRNGSTASPGLSREGPRR
jgi:hypothetical protein